MKIRIDYEPVFSNFGKLPGVPSTLIRIAMKDLERAEKVHTISMGEWCTVNDEDAKKKKACQVCLAGSVMVGKMKYKPKPGDELQPESFPKEAPALYALNALREGNLHNAFEKLKLDIPKHLRYGVDIVDYYDDRRKFKRQMRALADALEAEGY